MQAVDPIVRGLEPCEDEMIRTKPVKEWGKNAPDLNKKPTVFALYK